jgi:uncharacterized protein (DUF2141 family)
LKYLLYIFTAFSFWSCAQIESPTGGPKDEQPSKIVKANPEIGATNFTGTELKIVFDEYIVLGNMNQEAIVSPPMAEEPEYKVNNKTLKISFQENLLPNTTYTINLGEGVKDFHEGVVLDSNVLVFSTGDYIDSLSFNGLVKDAFTLAPQKDILVLLFEDNGDSIPSKERPYYYTKSNENGQFEFNYLKPGEFSLIVLEDNNNDRLYNLPNEKIGFAENRVSTSNVDSSYSIVLFEPDNKKQYLVSLKAEDQGKLILILNKPAKQIDLKIVGKTFKNQWFESDTLLTGDTIHLWTDISRLEDNEVEVIVTADNEILDTVNLKLKAFDTLKPKLPAITPNVNNGTAKYFNSLIVSTTVPIKNWNDSIILIRDSKDSVSVGIEKIGSKKLKILYKLEQESKYSLVIPDSFLTDILDFKSKGSKIDFKTKSDIEYANLKLSVELATQDNVILQFMSKGGAILKEEKFKGNKKFNYQNLSPGEYQIKMIFDANNDGIWTTGKYIPRTQPERVIFYSEKLEMKEGWDKDITWIIPE